MGKEFTFDVFIGHNSKDKPRVRNLAERLRDDGVRVWYDEWEVRAGDVIIQKVESGLEVARKFMLAISAHAFDSDWVSLERTTAMHRDPMNKESRFIPLLLEDCDMPDTIRRLRYVDWRAESDDEYEKLVRAILPTIDTPIRSIAAKDWLRPQLREVNRNVLHARVMPDGRLQFPFAGSAAWMDRESLIIIFHLDPGLTEAGAVGRVRDAITATGSEWLFPDGSKWILRTDVMRRSVAQVRGYKWLNGNQVVVPEVGHTPMVLNGKQVEQTSVTFSVGENEV
jgi:hypothetical protein